MLNLGSSKKRSGTADLDSREVLLKPNGQLWKEQLKNCTFHSCSCEGINEGYMIEIANSMPLISEANNRLSLSGFP